MSTIKKSVVRDQPGHPVAAPCAIEHCMYAEMETVLRTTANVAAHTIAAELRVLAAWIRTPGQITPADAVEECARLLESRAATYESSAPPVRN